MRKVFYLSLIALIALPAFARPAPVKVRVREWFTERGVFVVNIVLPEEADDKPVTPDQRYAVKCAKGIDPGIYDALYDKEKAKVEIHAVSFKGKAETIKCTVVDHEWAQPSER